MTTSLGERLRVAIEQTGVSQTTLAEALGVSQPAVSAWCADRRTPRAESVIKIADMLGVSVDWLLLGRRLEVSEQRAYDAGFRAGVRAAKEAIDGLV